MRHALSVVVPFAGARGLAETLEALAGRRGPGLRVVMVDGGSGDGADTVAKEFAAKDDRFVLVGGEEGESPRNVGVRHATGTYLAFADPGDLLSPAPLVASLERTGADLALGRSAGVRYPEGLFEESRPGLNLRREPRLVHHRTLGARVFRRSFWDRHGLAFRTGPYADLPLLVTTDVLAATADVVAETVHGHPAPVAQDPRALLAALTEAAGVLAEHAPRLRTEFDRSVIGRELRWLLHTVATVEDSREELFDTAHAYLRGVSRDLFHDAPAVHRMRCHLTAEGSLDEFLELTRYEHAWGTRAGVIQRGVLWRTWYHHYPQLFDNRVPQELLRAAREMTFTARVDRVETTRGTAFTLTGHAYVELLDLPGTEDGQLKLTLVDAPGRRRIPLDVQRVDRPDLTANSAQASASYRGGGFVTVVDAARLEPGVWRLEADFTHHGVRRRAFVTGAVDERRRRPPGVRIGADLWAQPVCTDGFELRIRQLRALVTGCSVEDGDLLLTGWAAAPGELFAGPAALSVAWTDGDGFRARIALRPLRAAAEAGALPLRLGDARLTAGDLPPVAACGLVLRRTRYGLLALARRQDGPRVLRAAVEEQGGVLMSGDLPGGLWLRHTGTGERRALPPDPDGAVPLRPAGLLPITGGEWDIVDADDTPATIDRAAAARLPGPVRQGRAEFDLRVTGRECLRLRVRPGLRDEERGGFHQRRLAEQHYPRLRARPLFDRVVFEARGGTRCAGSPLALFDALRERRPDLDLLWVARDASFTAPEGADCVVRDSAEHYAALATSRWLVSDGPQPEWFRKRDGQIYLQTWHGNPLVGLGFDPGEPRGFAEAAGQERIAADAAQWDLLVSPNAYSTQILRRAFGYEGPVVESGYPRNDVLASAEAAERAAPAARARLGVPADAYVVLHDRALDLAPLRRAAAPGTVFLAAADHDPTDLCLAADTLVTGVSALMFDFAVTGRPVFCHRPVARRRFFDVEAEGPGPVLDDPAELVAALRDPEGSSAEFAARFCPLDDGLASVRVLRRVFDRARDERVFGVSRKKRKRKAR
ncbi:CDP-glycerol glycerophosphotransferase family protein [Actinocorallia sp. API 0066]|uniref:bifunctional glycosyltransferase/CDP-glycerol:glycerophosphate glycerophosphotransferase n=1 Tax=Actinocorallia sp. API 0066 TaxID=2896846 RepID=UPI001E34B621|nr:CDP-glycerol glycerophosphotransferase family protein [Actinocorallia sp. API 0066]MCD0453179.1 CDP-glycerol glycerophosphotransferase family protein [Actinocorallia sp. API 0066]